ncbi:hypothetical protein [Actinoplanes sp. OR16]|uniref:hypothetical protein n=1 Tax=Actinoplanes sp. OR16 TaxID=946334 RepID=UPI000FDA53E0|nr:hypothetical protein [Actinoplanes sp. OR16]
MTRTPKILILCAALTLAVTGYAHARSEPQQVTEVAEFETVALQAAGFDEAPAPSASSAEKPLRPRAVRKLLRKNTLHGEVVVQGREGERTIVVQRGKVTAADGSGFTVKSADGFEQAWTFGDPVRVTQKRTKADRAAITTGARVAVGGTRAGDSVAARLVVLQ